MDITAGGGSIPFEAGRLGLRSIANELNPVAAIILRATCRWPQQYGHELLDSYGAVRTRFRQRVSELLEGVYPTEPQPLRSRESQRIKKDARPEVRPNVPLGARRFLPFMQRTDSSLSQLAVDFRGKGHPASTERGEWPVRLRDSRQRRRSIPRHRQECHRHLSLSQLWGHHTTELHLPGSSGRSVGPPTLLRHLQGPMVAPPQARQVQEAAQDQARLSDNHSEGRPFYLGRPTAEGTQTAVGRCRCPSQ